MPAHSYLRKSGLVALTAALTIGAARAPALAAPTTRASGMPTSMPMGSPTPEHVADALAALRVSQLAHARTDLRRAIESHAEPMDARVHAKEALAALAMGDTWMAKMHTTSGAAVEHLTYALRALRAGQTMTARGHLTEAAALPKVRAHAQAALAAIRRGDRRAALPEITAGLKAANRE